MSKRTGLFLGVAFGVLIVGLGTGIVASYMGLQSLAIIGGDPDELGYLPDDARIVAYANVREVMDSELRQKIQQLQDGTDGGRAKVQEAIGLDVEKDIDQIFAVMVPVGTDPGTQRPLAIIRGRFDEVRIEGLVREQGAVVEDYKGERLLVRENQDMAVAFVEPGVVAVGSPVMVRLAIDTKAGGAPDITKNADVMRLLHEVDDGNAWAVAKFDEVANAGRLPSAVADRLPPIGWFGVSGYVNGGIRAAIRAEARDEKAAQDLRDVIQGFIALARMQMGQRQDLADLMNSFELGGAGTTVTLGFALPSETIDALGALRANRDGPQR